VKGEDEQWDLNNDIIQEEIKNKQQNISQQRAAVVEHNLSGLYSEAGLFSCNENNFYKRNHSILLEKEYSCRAFGEFKEFKNLAVGCIKRYVIFNNSDKDFKIRFNFMSNEDFANFYMPHSEIVIIAKKHSVNNTLHLCQG
jgi:hypothetical protein